MTTIPTHKQCPRCERVLELNADNFYRRSSKNHNKPWQAYCKDCCKLNAIDWTVSNHERALVIRRRYYKESTGKQREDESRERSKQHDTLRRVLWAYLIAELASIDHRYPKCRDCARRFCKTRHDAGRCHACVLLYRQKYYRERNRDNQIARATAWGNANIERRREIQRAYARRKYAAKRKADAAIVITCRICKQDKPGEECMIPIRAYGYVCGDCYRAKRRAYYHSVDREKQIKRASEWNASNKKRRLELQREYYWRNKNKTK